MSYMMTPSIIWALLLKGQKGGGAVWESSGHAAQYYYHMLLARLGMGEGEKGKRKCWKQSLVTRSDSSGNPQAAPARRRRAPSGAAAARLTAARRSPVA